MEKLSFFSDLLDQHTFLGFYCNWISQLLCNFYSCFILTFSGLFHIGMCTYLHAITNDLKTTIEKLDCDSSSNRSSHKKARFEKSKSWTIYVDAISLHNDIIKYWIFSLIILIWIIHCISIFFHSISVAVNFRDIMQSILFYQLALCVLFSAFSLFAFDQSFSSHGINYNTVLSLTILLCALNPTFFYCYFADGLTADLLEVGDIFFESMWYELPKQEQKLLISPIQCAQRIFRMKGYGIVDCSLEMFTKVNF